MRRVFGFGETLLDIIFKENIPISAKAGGSVLNAIVSLSRMGCNCSLISEIGVDNVGEIIKAFLVENQIDMQYVYQHRDVASTLALAFLDNKNDATYQFYKFNPAKRFNTNTPNFTQDDILLFGSTLSINKEVRHITEKLVDAAANARSIIIYDPNCRKDHSTDYETRALIESNFAKATITRCSDEDLQNIYGKMPLNDLIARVKMFCKNIIITQNSKNVAVDFESIYKEFPVAPIVPLSTIGAGDNFNAGIIYSLIKGNIWGENISRIGEPLIDLIVQNGIEFSSEVCLSLDNYLGKKG